MPQWLEWAREIQGLCQTGLTFASTGYETQRYTRLNEIAAEIVASQTNETREALVENFSAQPGYATAKIDVRGAVVRDGGILLVRERRDQKWCLPGGWADVGISRLKWWPARSGRRAALKSSPQGAGCL